MLSQFTERIEEDAEDFEEDVESEMDSVTEIPEDDEDEGNYYYVGLDGCRVYSNYSSDGNWVDENGEWDPFEPKLELQFEPQNNTYAGDLRTFDVYMDDASKIKM